MLFEAQLKPDGAFQRAIHLLSKLIPSGLEGRLQCDSDIIKLRLMDKTAIFVIDVSLDPQRAFRTYRCDEPACLPFDSIGLSRALKHNEIHELNHAVRLASCWESGTQAETLGVYVEGKEGLSSCEVSLTDDHVTVTVPPIAYACTVTMPTSTLSDMIRRLGHLFLDTCTIQGTLTYILAPRVVLDGSPPPITREEEIDLITKIHAAMEVIPSVTHCARHKRKNSAGPNSAPPNKVRRTHVPKPRQISKRCVGCGQMKPCRQFFRGQLDKRKGRCIVCFPPYHLGRMISYADWKRRAWSNITDVPRSEVWRLRMLGCERYECPKFFGEKAHNVSDDLLVSFQLIPPPFDEVVGDYHIVYEYSESGPFEERTYKQRTTRGKLTLRSTTRSSQGGGSVLHGLITMSPSLTGCIEPPGGSFSFVQSVEGSGFNFEVPIKVTEPPCVRNH